MDFVEFQSLASLYVGETNLIDKKSIEDYRDILGNKAKIISVLSKAVSAFSNHMGGIILIGVKDNGDIEEGIENLIGKGTAKEWLEDVVHTSVSPSLVDFNIKKVKNENKFCFAVIINRSKNAPHQSAVDNRYYSRIDGKSKPIDGILVRDIFLRKQTSDIIVIPELSKIEYSGAIGQMELIAINESQMVAEKVVVMMELSKPIINGSATLGHGLFGGNNGQFKAEIIYPGLNHNMVGREKIKLKEFGNVLCNIKVVAKNMPLKEQVFSITQAKGNFTCKRLK